MIVSLLRRPIIDGLRNYGVDGQIGLEPTLDEYLEKLLKITAELKRVLKPTGILFWNHGDCYGGMQGKFAGWPDSKTKADIPRHKKPKQYQKCLMLQNWRLILEMIDTQGWILRNVLIWHKPNHMPSSVKDRFANAYEPVFMLVKNKKYYFDLDAVRVPHTVCGVTDKRPMGILRQKLYPNSGYNKSDDPHLAQYKFNYRVRDAEKKSEQCPQFKATKEEIERYKKEWEMPYHPSGDPTIHGQRLPPQPNQEGAFHPLGKNPGDLWQIPTQPAPPEVRGKFFAMFPEKLVEPMILAGCPEFVCKKCGKPREKVFETHNPEGITGRKGKPMVVNGKVDLSKEGKRIEKGHNSTVYYSGKFIGWTDCGCNAGFEPGIVLDPFMGSGTTAVVAKKLGRDYIGIELNSEYVSLARERLKAIPTPLI